MITEINDSMLFRINSQWVFDKRTGTGYEVIRKKGDVVGIEPAFFISKADEIKYYSKVPMGILRKSVKLIN